jgi:hypothetical protein
VAVELASSHTSLASLIDGYSRRVCGAVLEQHEANSISSPLGIWLVLAACATAATAEDRRELEAALGCSSLQATDLLVRFLEDPPPALRSGLALWVRIAEATPALAQWSATLPTQVERGDIPSQVAADAWADRHTLGLIKRFPSQLTHLTRLVLSSVLATKVSWQEPFEVVPAQDHLRPSSPWRNRVGQVLLDRRFRRPPMMLATTEAAGVVAVHFALAVEDLAVLSVAADPDVDRRLALEAAYEIARLCREDGLNSAGCSLFDLPVGSGHSWEITEREVLTGKSGERSEQIESAVLATWHAESELKLQASEAFGIRPAVSALFRLIGPDPRGDEVEAIQAAVASFTPTGFEAAAISTVTLTGSTGTSQPEKGLLRTARLYFDHPYAAVALAGGKSDFTRARAGHTELFCLPLFSAWVSTPHDPEASSPT